MDEELNRKSKEGREWHSRIGTGEGKVPEMARLK
jgi:hypothetical protein